MSNSNIPLPPTAITPEIQLLDGPYADTALAEFAKEQVIEFTPLPPTAVTPELQILDGPAADTALSALRAKEEAATEFTSFKDGSFFKYMPREGFLPQCVLVDAEGNQLGVMRNQDLAEFMVNAANLFVLATLKNRVDEQTLVQPGSPIILPSGATPPVYES